MNKQDFLIELKKGLSGLPEDDIEERLNFYSEMIDDRMEDGVSEETAVSGLGDIKKLTSEIIADIPLKKLVKKRITPNRKLKALEIILLVLGSPIWLSLLIAVLAVILSIYVSLWSIIASFWVIFVSLIVCAVFGTVFGIWTVNGNILAGIAVIGVGIICAGLSVFMFFGCKEATKGILILTKKLAIFIKNCFIKKEEA